MKYEINDLTLVVSLEGDTIHIAKKDKKDMVDNLVTVVETGKDIKDLCIKAVMEHMLSQIEDGDEAIVYTIDGKCELRLTDLREK